MDDVKDTGLKEGEFKKSKEEVFKDYQGELVDLEKELN